MNARVLLAIATVGLLAGCMVGPDYVRPAAPMTAAYKEEGWKVAEPRDDVLRGPWWTLFGDPLLDSLVERVSVSNQNVRAAEAQYRQSRALVQQVRAGLFPTLDLDLATTRGRAPSLSNRPSLARGPVNNYDAGLIASWEPDLWGRVRRAIESNEASWQASAADLELVRLSSQAELAVDYFNLREADLQKKILEDTVAAYERSLQLTRNRYAVGVVGKVDVVQAEAQLKSAQAQLLDVGVA
ncbi:MAG: TolC family protein, partial [Burkholderiales bacterium]